MELANMINNTVVGVISAAIFILIGVALGPTITAATADINATTLSGVPLADVIVTLAGYVGAFYYLAIVIGGIAMVWAATKVHT